VTDYLCPLLYLIVAWLSGDCQLTDGFEAADIGSVLQGYRPGKRKQYRK